VKGEEELLRQKQNIPKTRQKNWENAEQKFTKCKRKRFFLFYSFDVPHHVVATDSSTLLTLSVFSLPK
jgi:hypothetical protein